MNNPSSSAYKVRNYTVLEKFETKVIKVVLEPLVTNGRIIIDGSPMPVIFLFEGTDEYSVFTENMNNSKNIIFEGAMVHVKSHEYKPLTAKESDKKEHAAFVLKYNLCNCKEEVLKDLNTRADYDMLDI